MKNINEVYEKINRPIKVIQFGEGNFLRAFADWMIDILNEKTDFNGNIALVKPITMGSLERFYKQDCLYTVLLRGKNGGKTVNESRVITSIQSAVSCEEEDKMNELSKLDSLRFVISNTTEAGIVFKEDDHIEGLPDSFPGKVTKFLYQRFVYFGGDKSKGLIFLPVELIENNGKKLLECILKLCDLWNLPESFKAWIKESNIFCNTLVDRIVTGYAKDEAESIFESLGYRDELLDIGEPFGLWVIEGDERVKKELPFEKASLPVVFTNDLKPYRERKVRILNGAHTSGSLIGYLSGLDIVRDCMEDKSVGSFMRSVIEKEIAPLISLPKEEVNAFTLSVLERFENPFLDHSLLSISLNSVSKWKTRVLPTFKDFYNKNGIIPKGLTFSFAALLAFYSSETLKEDGLYATRQNGDVYTVHDDMEVLKFFSKNSKRADFVELTAQNTAFWGEDLSKYEGFTEAVSNYLDAILKNAADAVKAISEELK